MHILKGSSYKLYVLFMLVSVYSYHFPHSERCISTIIITSQKLCMRVDEQEIRNVALLQWYLVDYDPCRRRLHNFVLEIHT